MNKILKIVFITVVLWPAWLFSQINFFISLKGNDANPGIQARPFASINRAMAEARITSGKVVIYL
jgi:hypothetical protein